VKGTLQGILDKVFDDILGYLESRDLVFVPVPLGGFEIKEDQTVVNGRLQELMVVRRTLEGLPFR